jgi:hypothetical protein
MASAAGALSSAVIGGIGFSLLQTSGFGFTIDWKSRRTWWILLPCLALVPGLWLLPWILYFISQGTTLLWILRAGIGLLGLILVRTVIRNTKADRQNMPRIGLLLCLLLASVAGLLSLQTRRCSATVLRTAQYLCWGTDFSGKPEWHAYVGPYSIADNYAAAQGMERAAGSKK